MTRKMLWRLWFILGVLVVTLAACDAEDDSADSSSNTGQDQPAATLSAEAIRIVSGSENRELEPIIMDWAERNNQPVVMEYLGSIDIARLLQSSNGGEYDAVWPANSLWLNYGDTSNLVQHTESIMRSPVVLGIKRSVAESLGWIDAEVTMTDILEAAESGDLRFMMTSATQSNSGASFYFAALSAFAGGPEVITEDDLATESVREQITRILGTVNRSSGSSGWLSDLFIDTYNIYDGMVNYEALIIETNLELESRGLEPLYAIYPIDGLAIADSPLGFVRRTDNADKEEAFLELQEYLLSETAQRELLAAGRRTGLIGLQIDNANTSVFRPEWGIDVDRVIQPIRFPTADVIREALNLYQTAFRRPSCTVIAVDRSSSMSGMGEESANAGLRTLLNQTTAEQYLLQAHPEDRTTIVLFNEGVMNDFQNDEEWTVVGNDPDELGDLYLKAESVYSGGNTNIFGTAQEAHEWLAESRSTRCLPAIILMTDGQDNSSNWFDFRDYLETTENDIPVFVITFANASEEEVEPMTEFTFGRIFDGRDDLVAAFRSAKGYN